MGQADRLIHAATRLSKAVATLRFSSPVTHVYNPLVHAARGHRRFLRLYGNGVKPVLFLGMNPGPYGMTQTGVPFGEVSIVRDWLGIHERIDKPENEHPKRPVEGFECTRSEVSGARLWGAIAEHWKTPAAFFKGHFIVNYCPLIFMEASGRNRTPDKLPAAEREALYKACDLHLQKVAEILEPQWVVGIGAFAEKRAIQTLGEDRFQFGRILHPSPASPAANRDWAGAARADYRALGFCSGARAKKTKRQPSS